ncbi:hypothetical protein AGR5A_pa10007 [Agrobacterium genomosp. 5 str. CFBP 6626]|nr:hypothetical protein AGR5A_pa10007 [Agrobacterium genomosp. 5 str. CFBP 6626]
MVALAAHSPQTWSRLPADLVAQLPQTWSRLSADLVALPIIRIQNTFQNTAEHHQNNLSKRFLRITEKGLFEFFEGKEGRGLNGECHHPKAVAS